MATHFTHLPLVHSQENAASEIYRLPTSLRKRGTGGPFFPFFPHPGEKKKGAPSVCSLFHLPIFQKLLILNDWGYADMTLVTGVPIPERLKMNAQTGGSE
jgi:hypothetical protein